MKNLIIIIGTILLGTILFQMLVGEDSGSMKSVVTTVMRYQISQYAGQGGS
jgi:hypothetical protein